MSELDEKLKAYADLLIVKGCDMREGQELLLSASIDVADFVRMVVKSAYEHGCKRVTVSWSDDKVSRMTYDYCDESVFREFPEWRALMNNSMAENGAAILDIESEDPEIMNGVDPKKMMANALASHKACKQFYDCLDFGKTIWCIAGAAAPAWAKKVFPDLDEETAVSRLWDAILHTSRSDGPNPLAAWDEHDRSFAEHEDALNGMHVRKLHYTASNGTNFTIGLPDGVIWHGGSGLTVDGRTFFPNIPTEEVYTSPHRMTADGIVHCAMPLVHNGNLITNFWIRFEEGKAVEWDAEQGRDILSSIIETDEGSARIGEVALVPYSSPIRQTGVLFYSTLYDENASCHIALGKSFPECLDGGLELTSDELVKRGLNESAVHVDFMVGTQDLNITAICDDDKQVAIFKDGEWAL